jgi:hypothetical protein
MHACHGVPPRLPSDPLGVADRTKGRSSYFSMEVYGTVAIYLMNGYV